MEKREGMQGYSRGAHQQARESPVSARQAARGARSASVRSEHEVRFREAREGSAARGLWGVGGPEEVNDARAGETKARPFQKPKRGRNYVVV
jgi:hypothetical protein